MLHTQHPERERDVKDRYKLRGKEERERGRHEVMKREGRKSQNPKTLRDYHNKTTHRSVSEWVVKVNVTTIAITRHRRRAAHVRSISDTRTPVVCWPTPRVGGRRAPAECVPNAGGVLTPRKY
ncbi:hypothetical protein EVAR_97763_1 [Eumeta japonica]|uniref:Uncharacterized protein n=1 Tax=Eumeta variegata TaxID=151549 RepID=A0A4C1X664_EUMVA|nr:hypothetical protein EVAR_97763_1 [Eumeta japonica]